MKISQRAFTLIEVLFATIILAGALIALTSSLSGTVSAFRKADKVQVITSLLKSKSTELELKYAKLGFTSIPEEDGGDFGDEFPDLSWTSQVKDLEFPDLKPLLITEKGADETTLTLVKQMTDYFSKNIKEIKITITWKTKKKNVDYSITSYIPNYAGVMPSPGGSQ